MSLKQRAYSAAKRVLPVDIRRDWKLRLVEIRRHLGPGLRPLPDFLVIGAMRAGTSSLYKYLDAHPECAASIRKETAYFTRRFEERDLTWYRAHFPIARGRKVFEATPQYLSHPLTPQRVATVIPDVSLVVMLRDPVTRARSQHGLWVSLGAEDRSFEEAIEDELARGLNRDEPGHLDYLSRSQYGLHLTRWLEHHDPKHIGIFESEDLYSGSNLRDIARFLGIAPQGFATRLINHSGGTDGRPVTDDSISLSSLPAAAQTALLGDQALLRDALSRVPTSPPTLAWLR